MKVELSEQITSAPILRQGYIVRDGFIFSSLGNPANVYDAIVIHDPPSATSFTPRYPSSGRTLSEHVCLINQLGLQKAIVVAENIDFLRQCPTLRHLSVVPADSAADNFDFSALYNLPCILSLRCSTEYGFMWKLRSEVDYANIQGLTALYMAGEGHKNFNKVQSLKTLAISQNSGSSLEQTFCSEELDTLRLLQCGIKSLDGLEKAQKMQCLYLAYNRNLQDIRALASVSSSLRALRIQNCPKLRDFSVLSSLQRLELLELSGKNELDNLSFIRDMPNLKTLILGMTVRDGDLSLCRKLSWVAVHPMKRHYNLEAADLPRLWYYPGNSEIEAWRRLE